MYQRSKTQSVVEAALCIALAVVFSRLRLFRLPQGGSVTLEIVPLLVYAMRWGLLKGIGAGAVALILGALAVRSLGVCLCTAGTPFTGRERLFCVLAYLPKATVQAAIGGVPLALGMPCGDLVLSVVVLSILLTAPLGAIAIDRSAPRLLEQEDASKSI